MKRLRLFLRLKLFTRRHPFWFFAIVAVPFATLYMFLDTFLWGVEVNNFISLMMSVEVGAGRLVDQGMSFWDIVWRLFAAHAANLVLDLFVVRTVLLSRRARQFLHIISVVGKEILNQIAFYLKIFFELVKEMFTNQEAKQLPHNEVVHLPKRKQNLVVRFWNHLDDVRKDPTKAGLWTVFGLCLLPRIPTPVGGVGFAVFLVKYNKMGWRGWAVITAGITCHLGWVLPSAYGVISFFE